MSEWVRTSAAGRLETAQLPPEVDLGYVELDFEPSAGAYALRVRGDALSPVADDGTVLLIEPADCKPRQRILVTLSDGRRFCGKLVEIATDSVYTTELNTPTQRTFDRIDVERIEWIKDILDVGVWTPGGSP